MAGTERVNRSGPSNLTSNDPNIQHFNSMMQPKEADYNYNSYIAEKKTDLSTYNDINQSKI